MNRTKFSSIFSKLDRWRFLAAVAVLGPVVYTLARGWNATRNVAYLDDIDGTLMLLVRLHDGGSWRDLFGWLFEIDNEHRMVTSRVMYVASYWLTDTVNFAFFGVLGNLFLCGLCAALVWAVGTTERRWTMALVLAGFLFQLEHFENFFWSGSSIDHFQVPLLAGCGIVLLARRNAWATVGAAAMALLATFTLAHGLALWPLGAVVLVAGRRWRELAAWLGLAAATVAGYFVGFEFNPAHHIDGFSFERIVRIAVYWLEVLGAPLAFGHEALALALGVLLLAGLGVQLTKGGLQREPVALPLALWAVMSLALMAVGRASLGSPLAVSRYYVLSALAWALVLFSTLQRREFVNAPRLRWWLVPALMVFNVAVNLHFDGIARRWAADRDEAVRNFVRFGHDGEGPTALHPMPQHATRVIRQAEALGVFEMPRESEERTCPANRPAERVSYAVDRIGVEGSVVTIDGWAAIAGLPAREGDVEVVLQSENSMHVLTTGTVTRPDVAAAFPAERWREAGFHFAVRRWLLPDENYHLGLLVRTEHGNEFVLTSQRVDLSSNVAPVAVDQVAPNRLVYDEVVLRAPTTTVTASPRKFARVTFFDLQGSLVHVDFSGAGEMTVALNHATALAPPVRDRNRVVAAMRGSAAISIQGADESTNIAVYAARRLPPALDPRAYVARSDGLARIAAISIQSRDGRFGAVRTGNVVYAADAGIVGIHAPGVRFSGPVNVGNIMAFASALPKFELGFARDTRVIGGDLFQPNGRPVDVSGILRLRFVEGRTAQGARLPALDNRAVLLNRGRDVSARLVRAPAQALAGDEE